MPIKQLSMVLWACLLIISTLYTQANFGGIGLNLTFNIAIWFIAVWLIVILFWQTDKTLKLPKNLILFSCFPIYILIMNIWGTNTADLFLSKLLFIMLGCLFFIALLQSNFSEKDIDSLLFLVVIAAFIHAVISLTQILFPETMLSPWSGLRDNSPRGVFQQVNVNSSFLATAVIISVYLMSRTWFSSANVLKKTILWSAYALSLYIVFASGSRVGLLGLILALPLIVTARLSRFTNKKKILGTLFSLLAISLALAYSGLETTADKTQNLKDKGYGNARIAMYTIGAEIVVQKPLGHGIGSFLKPWNTQSSDFVERNPETTLPTYVTHPHNELLLWAIEGGIPALLALLLIVIVIFIGLYKCGYQSGGAFAALLIPISLHTQVELPFYISALHWFLWLFFIYLVFRKQVIEIEIKLSQAMGSLLKIAGVGFAILSSIFLINTAKAQQDIYNFVNGIKSETPPLSIALNNLYTKNYAEQLAMRSNLYANIDNNNKQGVEDFVIWAKEYVDKRPELKMYEDLISASLFLNPEGKGCDMIEEALTMYAHNKPLQRAKAERCQ